jgi:hypothetical protein
MSDKEIEGIDAVFSKIVTDRQIKSEKRIEQ